MVTNCDHEEGNEYKGTSKNGLKNDFYDVFQKY